MQQVSLCAKGNSTQKFLRTRGCQPLQNRRHQTCRPNLKGRRPSLQVLIADYRKTHALKAKAERNGFSRLHSLEDVIRCVAYAVDVKGKCFGHQYRIIRSARRQAALILANVKEELRACKSFDKLHCLLSELLLGIHGIGKLYVYDAAVRIGAYLKQKPKFIYLHAGTRIGAKSLAIRADGEYLRRCELPLALQVLTADDLENFLCIYRDFF